MGHDLVRPITPFHFFFFFRTLPLSSFWTSRGYRCRPFSPPQFLPSFVFALSASQYVHKKKSQRIYTSMHSAGLELTKLTYTRLEDNLIRHRGDRLIPARPWQNYPFLKNCRPHPTRSITFSYDSPGPSRHVDIIDRPHSVLTIGPWQFLVDSVSCCYVVVCDRPYRPTRPRLHFTQSPMYERYVPGAGAVRVIDAVVVKLVQNVVSPEDFKI